MSPTKVFAEDSDTPTTEDATLTEKGKLMKKTKYLICLLLAASIAMSAAAYAEGLGNFTEKRTYAGQFSDVPAGSWYEANVARAYSLALVDGKSEALFEPLQNMTLAEAIKLAACLHSIYNTGEVTLQNGSPWYSTYVEYCLQNGILTSALEDYNAYATRAQFAVIFASALPPSALPAINEIDEDAIPDVKITDSYSGAVYMLYRAGILTGSDAIGTYNPLSNITRAEMATIVSRMADTGLRREFSMLKVVPGAPRITSILYSSSRVYITVAAENCSDIYYSFSGTASRDSQKTANAGFIQVGESLGLSISLMPSGSMDGEAITLDLRPYYDDILSKVAWEIGYLNAGTQVMENITAITPRVRSGGIADASSNADILELGTKISAEAKDFLESGVKEYIALGERAQTVAALVTNLSTKTPGYASQMGLALWQAAASEYATALQSVRDTSNDRMRVEY